MDKNKGMMMVIIAMLAVIIIAIAVAIVVLLTGDFGGGNNGEFDVPHIPQAQEFSAQDIVIFELPNAITTNLLQSADGTGHVVRVEVGIGINNTDQGEATDFLEMLIERDFVVRDTVTTILRRTTIQQLESVGGDSALADDILAALQDEFGSTLIVRVFLGNLFAQ
ncbi:MAG: flagellar basal body-associated FliL family protein [Defluviitaleaceae bacterium]|nr:flagellar basal body-associated FliL family protein [Defluviitaleaceae bacterium]